MLRLRCRIIAIYIYNIDNRHRHHGPHGLLIHESQRQAGCHARSIFLGLDWHSIGDNLTSEIVHH